MDKCSRLLLLSIICFGWRPLRMLGSGSGVAQWNGLDERRSRDSLTIFIDALVNAAFRPQTKLAYCLHQDAVNEMSTIPR